jgi:hypothetical protein
VKSKNALYQQLQLTVVVAAQHLSKKPSASPFKLRHSLLFEGTLTSFLKIKSQKSCHKAVDIKVFLTIFAW